MTPPIPPSIPALPSATPLPPALADKEALIAHFVDLIEAKDPYTQGHSHHVKVVVEAMLNVLPPDLIRGVDRESLLEAAFLHDVGKILVPDVVLNKNGGLDPDEWRVMRLHPENAAALIGDTVFRGLLPSIMHHHEYMDGSGYLGMKGEDIPLESRIIAIADMFSALRTYRVYRPAKDIDEAVKIMDQAGGAQLDRALLKHFLAIDRDVLAALECFCATCDQRKAALAVLAARM